MKSKTLLRACLMVLAGAGAGTATSAFADAATDTQTYQFDVKAQSLAAALNAAALQSHRQILFTPEVTNGKSTAGVQGALTIDEALNRLLLGTGLSPSNTADGMILVSPADGKGASATSGPLRAPTGAANDRSSNEDASSLMAGTLAEVIVTAQKREERLQDVPVPVTAITADSLVSGGQRRLEDYYNKVPGLSLTMVDDGFTSVAIRGVTAGGIGSSPTVATVVDDIPFGATFVVNGYQESVSDFDPSELSRVEVLRGPQGTLYGASSMGGLIKYVTVDPSTAGLSGQIRVGANGVKNGDAGYDVFGAVNVPLSDTWAVRASASSRRDPGYIDNVLSGEDGVNRFDSQTARIASLWRPSDDFSVKLSAQYQHSKRGGSSEVDLSSPASRCPNTSDLQQCDLRDTGWQKQEFQAYSAIVKKRWNEMELTSLTGYSVKTISNLQDYSPSFLGTFLAPTFFGVNGFLIGGSERMTKLSQELRFSTPLGSHVDWMLGLFYTRENGHTPYLFQAVDSQTLARSSIVYPPGSDVPPGVVNVGDDPQGYKEYAVFTDFTVKLTDRFDVQIGGRESHNKLYYSSSSKGLINVFLTQPVDNSIPKLTSTDSPFTYLLSPRFKVSPDLMVYGRLASGYRPGGFNINPAIRAQGHPDFTHDTVQSYELGAKGDAFDRMLTFDASLYYIDWKDIQLQLTDPNDVTVKYVLNAGKAKSKGAEVALTLRPTRGLDLSLWTDFNDATLTSVPSNSFLTAKPGDRLPYSARWSGGFSADQSFPINASVAGFLGASLTYVGDRRGQFLSGANNFQGTFPSYAQADLRGGVSFDDWKIDAFVNNATDRRGVLRNGNDSLMGLAYRATYIRPRNYGLSVTRSF